MTESNVNPYCQLHPVPPDSRDEQFAAARVLVIDDDPANVALLAALLALAGYRNVVTEMDPREVLAMLPEVDPDLVILDLRMPHLDGFAVLAQIREFAPAEALPVLVLTADATPMSSERALGCGAQDFVIKPFSTGEVLVRVRNLLRARFVYTALQSAITHRREAVLRALWLMDTLDSEQQSAERLRFLDGVKDTLLQTVSHDLRNPIWAMLLLTDVLADDADGTRPLPADSRSGIISKIQHSARQMERLLEDILGSDPMRTVNGDHDPCEVADVVNRVLAEVDLGRDHPLKVIIAPVQADIDPAHLERIVENLLSNARQHVAPGVPIWVTVAPCQGGMVFSVEDAGPGVPPDIAGSIFEPFRRGRAAAGVGFGLGLSLVARFAQLHKGRAWTEERQGGGAAFRVFLPSAVASASTQAAAG